MSVEENNNANRELVRRWAEAHAAGKDQEATNLYSKDVRFIPPITPQDVIIGREAMRSAALGFRESEPDYKMQINEPIADGGTVVLKWTTTFSKGDIECLGVFRVRDGEIVELQEYYTGDGYKLFGGVEHVKVQE